MVTLNSGALPALPQNTFLPPGQTPLTLDPFVWGKGQWQGTGGGTTAQQFYAAQDFSKLFGRNPTQSELDQYAPFFASGDPNIANTSGGNQAISSYYNQQQQAANAPQQEADALKAQIPIINDLIQQQTASATKGLSDPNNPTYQNFSGMFNNLGITPGSGAFNAGLGSTIGNAANQSLEAALGAIGLPIASGYSQGAMAPFMQAIQQPQQLFEHNLQQQDYFTQAQLAQKIAEQNAPSDFQKYGMPLASSALQGAAQGGTLATASYVCREMKKRGLLCDSDLEDFYFHMFDAVWRKARAFWHYKVNGQKLVDAVNAKGLDWRAFKPLLFDRVMEEKDPCKANDLFADACHQLCISVAPELWDARVLRTSFWDSLPFIPLLFLDSTFGKNFWRIFKIKFMWLYDKPRCEVHHGIR